MTASAEVIVVGLGGVGSATLYQLACRGVRALGVDRYVPPHDLGSSHGQSRITRQAIGEGEAYAPLALRAHSLWREIEAQTHERLMLPTGCLVIGALDFGDLHVGKRQFVRRTIEVAQRFSIPHEVLNADETRRRFPQFSPREDEVACFEPGGGVLFPERCISAQLRLAIDNGARIQTGEVVTAIATSGSGVRVTTDEASYDADQVVVCAGAWLPGLLGGRLTRRLRLFRQVMFWFTPSDAAQFAPPRMPVFVWMHDDEPEGWFYGCPMVDGFAAVKVASEQFAASLSRPEQIDRRVSASETSAMHSRHVAGRLKGVTTACVRSTACTYTMAPDSRFVIGRDPDQDRVVVVSACSGHGFKHSAAIGEAVAQLVTDSTPPTILDPFRLERTL